MRSRTLPMVSAPPPPLARSVPFLLAGLVAIGSTVVPLAAGAVSVASEQPGTVEASASTTAATGEPGVAASSAGPVITIAPTAVVPPPTVATLASDRPTAGASPDPGQPGAVADAVVGPRTSAAASLTVVSTTVATARVVAARIAFTGADVAGMILTGVALLAAGIGMTWTTRRQNAAGRHLA